MFNANGDVETHRALNMRALNIAERPQLMSAASRQHDRLRRFRESRHARRRIIAVDSFPEARKPAYRLTIDFGANIGVKRSSAQLTARCNAADLIGRLVVAVVNFPPRQIGPFMSEMLTLGVPDIQGAVALLAPDSEVPLGGNVF